MFRYRIYAQGLTLVAIVAGSIFYKDERMKRKALEGNLEDKKQSEKKEKWLAELEARDKDDREWREGIEKQQSEEMGIREVPVEGHRRVGDETKKVVEAGFKTKSMREQIRREGWGPAMWVRRTSEAWKRM
jgi:Hypoxia induced protein conserved region